VFEKVAEWLLRLTVNQMVLFYTLWVQIPPFSFVFFIGCGVLMVCTQGCNSCYLAKGSIPFTTFILFVFDLFAVGANFRLFH
jgi:hypothetical protein